MKKKSSRRRTKIVRRSKKNLRRTIKRKNIRKSGRRPTRRYSRIQRGGTISRWEANKLYEDAMKYKQNKLLENQELLAKDIVYICTRLRKAAMAGHRKANYELGIINEKESDKQWESGNLIEENNYINSAIKNYAIASIQGHYQAWLELQRMFYEEYNTANESKENTFVDTFLAFKALQNAALAAVALSARAEKFENTDDPVLVNALVIEEEVMQKFRKFAMRFITDRNTNLNTGNEALHEVTQFKKKLETFVKKAPKQSVIADADGDDGDGDDGDGDRDADNDDDDDDDADAD